MTKAMARSGVLDTRPDDGPRAGPSPTISRSLQHIDGAARRLEQHQHQLSALQERALRAEKAAEMSLEDVGRMTSRLALAEEEILRQRQQIDAMTAKSEAIQDVTLEMIMTLREELAAEQARRSLVDGQFVPEGDDARAPGRIGPD